MIHFIHKHFYLMSVCLCMLALIFLCPVPASSHEMDYSYNFTPVDREFDSIASSIARHEMERRLGKDDYVATDVLKKIAIYKNNPILKARADLWSIRTTQLSAKPDSCILILENHLKDFPSDEYDYDFACLSYQLAGNHSRVGNYFNTYQLLQQAIPIFEKYGDNYFLGNAHLLMGLTYNYIGDMEMAQEEIELADKYYRLCNYPTNRIYFFLAALAKDKNEKLQLYKKSLVRGDDDPGMTIQAYDHIASYFNDMNLPDSAAYYVNLGKKMISELPAENEPLLRNLLLVQEARTLYNSGQYDNALNLLKRAEEGAGIFNDEYWEPSIYKYMALIYDEKGDSRMAFQYLKKYQESFEKQFAAQMSMEIPKSVARDAINKQKNLIREMEQDQVNARNRFIIVLLILTVIVFAACVAIILILNRAKVKHIENKQLRTSLEQEMIIKRLNTENFERDMKQKECEISSSVLLLSNKNDVLQQIVEMTKKYSDSGDIPREYVDQVNNLIRESLKGDDEWSRFKIHFDSVHPEFFTKLKKRSEELTENDLRLCAYIRIGMRAKDIASMLSVSPASVNTNRYRLRKKLGLSRDDSLDDFIRQI